MFTKLATLVSSLALCAAASGCVVDAGPPPSPTYGTLTVTWALDGSYDPDACVYYNIDRVDVVHYDDDGFLAAEDQPYCEDFVVSFDLLTGWYTTEVTLVDFDGFAASDTVIVDARVLRDTETFVDVDFPDGSIF